MSKALYYLQTAFSSQVDTNNIGTKVGLLQERFCHEGQKGGLGSTQRSPGPSGTPVSHCPPLYAPPLQYTQNPDVIISKDRDKEGLPRERTHACRHHLIAVYSWPKAWDSVEAHYKGNRILVTRESGVGSGGGGGGWMTLIFLCQERRLGDKVLKCSWV